MIVPVPSPPPQHIAISAVAAAGALELVQRRRDEARAGAAGRMAERDGAAVRVHALGVRAAAPSSRRGPRTRRPRSPRTCPCRRSRGRSAASTLRVAGIGPFSIVTGSTPTSVVVTMRARGLRPSALALLRRREQHRRRAVGHLRRRARRCARRRARPAFSAASFSSDVSRRPSSRATVRVSPVGLPSSPSDRRRRSGTTSRVEAALASTPACASCWLRRPKRSVSSRVMPYSLAIISAPWNCDANA